MCYTIDKIGILRSDSTISAYRLCFPNAEQSESELEDFKSFFDDLVSHKCSDPQVWFQNFFVILVKSIQTSSNLLS